MNKGLLGWPRAERFKGTRDFPAGGWQENLAAVETAGIVHTANGTWDQITSMQFYARKGEVYLVRVECVGISASNNFDDEYFSLNIRTAQDASAVLEATTNRYIYPIWSRVANRASSVNRSNDHLPRNSMFLMAGLPEGLCDVGISHWDGNTNMDRTIHYMFASIRRVGLPQKKSIIGPYGWPLRAPVERPSRLMGHAVDTSTRTLTATSTNERITGTEISFVAKADHEYEYIAYLLARGTTANFDREFFEAYIDHGDSAGYVPAANAPGVGYGFSANPASHEPVNTSANAQTTNQRGLSLHGVLYGFETAGAKTFAMFTNDNATGLDREIAFSSVVLLEAVPAAYGVAA